MLYLLDANVLIDANRDYYPLERVPEFWDWLLDRAARQHVKISACFAATRTNSSTSWTSRPAGENEECRPGALPDANVGTARRRSHRRAVVVCRVTSAANLRATWRRSLNSFAVGATSYG